MKIKVIGSRSSDTRTLEFRIRQLAMQYKIIADIEIVMAVDEISKLSANREPAVIIDNKLVAAGFIPTDEQILNWLRENTKI